MTWLWSRKCSWSLCHSLRLFCALSVSIAGLMALLIWIAKCLLLLGTRCFKFRAYFQVSFYRYLNRNFIAWGSNLNSQVMFLLLYLGNHSATWRTFCFPFFSLSMLCAKVRVMFHLLAWPFVRFRCLYFSVSGNHFPTSGAPRRTILAPRDHPGGPWEQQAGLEVVVYRILLDWADFGTCVY